MALDSACGLPHRRDRPARRVRQRRAGRRLLPRRRANAAIDDVRRRVQQETLGHRGHKHDPLYRIRRTLLAGIERLGPDALTRIPALAAGDPYDEVGCAWTAKELVRAVFATRDHELAARRLVEFYEWVALVEVPELVRLATTLSRWQDEFLAYHHTGGVSSARVEAINLDVKNIKRVARGFTNFDNYRARSFTPRPDMAGSHHRQTPRPQRPHPGSVTHLHREGPDYALRLGLSGIGSTCRRPRRRRTPAPRQQKHVHRDSGRESGRHRSPNVHRSNCVVHAEEPSP